MFVQCDVRRARLSAIRLPLSGSRCPGFRLPVLTRTSHLPVPWLCVGFLPFLGLCLALDGVDYARLPVRSSTFLRTQCWIARSGRRSRLLCLRTVEVRRLAGPAFVRKLREFLDLHLPNDVLLLFLEAWRVLAHIAKPLVPLGCSVASQLLTQVQFREGGKGLRTGNLHVCIVDLAVVFHNTPQPVAVQRILKLPERVPQQIDPYDDDDDP